VNETTIRKKNLVISLVLSLLILIFLKSEAVLLILPTFLSSFLLLEIISLGLQKGGSFFHPVIFSSIVILWSLVLSPVFCIFYESYLVLSPKDIDWNYWLSILSWFYMGCVIVYYLLAKLFLIKRDIKDRRFFDKKRVVTIGLIFLSVSLICQILVYLKFGGIIGYMVSWTESRDQFDGLGLLFMFSEPFPIIALILFCLLVDPNKVRSPLLIIVLLFIVFFVLKLLFGGFRGSRSNTIWGLFWFAGIVHLYFFRLKAAHFLVGLTFLILFMNLYSLYKSFGIDAFTFQYSLEDTGRFEDNPTLTILLNDFSRAGLHAFMLSQYFDYGFYEIKFGQTYLYTIGKLIPFFNPDFLYSKNSAGSEILYDRQSNLIYKDYYNTRIYGAYGEGFLNFGPFFAVFIFGLVSLFIIYLDNFCRSLNKFDPTYLVIPFLSNLSIILLIADSDNMIFFLLKNSFLVFLFIITLYYFAMRKRKVLKSV
jgi:hypothetical protein